LLTAVGGHVSDPPARNLFLAGERSTRRDFEYQIMIPGRGRQGRDGDAQGGVAEPPAPYFTTSGAISRRRGFITLMRG